MLLKSEKLHNSSYLDIHIALEWISTCVERPFVEISVPWYSRFATIVYKGPLYYSNT